MKLDLNQTLELIRAEVKDKLTELGNTADQAQADVAAFLEEIKPEVEEALLKGDLLSLNLIRDRVALKAADSSLELIVQSSQVVSDAVIAVLRILIRAVTFV